MNARPEPTSVEAALFELLNEMNRLNFCADLESRERTRRLMQISSRMRSVSAEHREHCRERRRLEQSAGRRVHGAEAA